MSSEKQKVKHQWRVVAVINFPKQLAAALPPAPGGVFPQRLTTVSRIPKGANLDVDDISVRLQPWTGSPLSTPLPPGPSGIPDEPATLIFFLTADTSELAQEKMEPILERLLDGLSFQLQTAILVFRLELLDVTPPVAVGMTRHFLSFPNGYPSPKFSQSIPLGNIKTSLYPNLSACSIPISTKIRAALRWYVKGMTALPDVDKFIFFWIALEIIRSESNVSVSEPYCAPCGHEIPTCPTCQKPTSREVLGKSMKALLTKRLGVTANNADTLWEFRQMLHGANPLTHQATAELPTMILILRQAVTAALKEAFGILPTDHPLVLGEGGLIDSSFGLGGTREIDTHDVDLGLPDK